MSGTVYLLHFERPVHHAQHYLGWTENLDRRLSEHGTREGSPLVAAAAALGIPFELVRTWDGDRHLERRLKDGANARYLCPKCRPAKNAAKAADMRRRRAA